MPDKPWIVKLEIVICEACQGRGWVYDRTGAYKEGYEPCAFCEGSGRLEEVTTRKHYKGGGIDK